MGLKTFVKVGNISNLSDARYCAGMGVDQLGFNINETDSSYMSNEAIESIRAWISGIEVISEGKIPEDPSLFDASQSSDKELLESSEKPMILEITLEELKSYSTTPGNLDYFMLVGDKTSLDNNDINEINNHSKVHPIVLSYGFDANNIEVILEQTQLKGIAMSGSQEIRPGFKDYDELADILELLDDDPYA